MAPASDPDHREMWGQINDLAREFAEHQGAFRLFREDVVRRQDDSTRDRHEMNLKLDELKTDMHRVHAKILTLILTIAGSSAVIVGGAVLQFVLKR